MQTLGKLEAIALRSLVKVIESNQVKSDKTYGKLEEVTKKYLTEIKQLGEAIENAKKSVEMLAGGSYDEVVALLKGEDIVEPEVIVATEDPIIVEPTVVESTIETPLVLNEEQQAFEDATTETPVVQETQGSEGEINFFKTN